MPRNCSIAAAGGRVFLEAKAVHRADYFDAQVVIEGEFGLIEQAIGACSARLPCRIEPHTALSDPLDQAAYLGRQSDGPVGDARAGFQKNAGQTADREVSADAILVDQHECAILDFNASALKPDHACPLFHGDGVGFESHGAGTTERSPSPIALPWPTPIFAFSLSPSL